MDTKKIAEYIKLNERKRELEFQLKTNQQEIDKLNEELVAAYTEEGIQNMSVNGKTAYLNRSIYSRLADGDNSLSAISDLDAWSWLISETINASKLSAAVRELPRDESDMPILPETLKEHVNVSEVFQIRVRKS